MGLGGAVAVGQRQQLVSPRAAVLGGAVMVLGGVLGLLADVARLGATPGSWVLLLDAGLAAALAVALVALPWPRFPGGVLVVPLLGGLVIGTLPMLVEPRPAGWLPLLPSWVWGGLVLTRRARLAAIPLLVGAVAIPGFAPGGSVPALEVVAATVIILCSGEGIALVAARAARARQRAERAEAWAAVLLTHAPGVVLVLDAGGIVREASAGVVRALRGMSPGTDLLAAVHPDDVGPVVAALRTAAHTVAVPVDVELRLAASDGGWRRLVATVSGVPADQAPGAAVILSAVDVTVERQARDSAVQLAATDPLTGLGNRSALWRAVDDALLVPREGTAPGGGLVFVDLDGFKLVNDALGHDVGDRLLRDVAERLGAVAARRGGTAARLSGDEFAVLDPGAGSGSLLGLGEDVLASLSGVEHADGHYLRVTASVGVAPLLVGRSVDDLLRRADLAMYRAKGAGGGRVQVYDGAVSGQGDGGDRAVADAELAVELADGLRRGEVCIHLQPWVRTDPGGGCRVVEVEAFARWHHPTRGLLRPAAFVPLAERAGLAPRLDATVLGLALEHASGWDAHGMAGVGVNVNVSCSSLAVPGWPEQVLAALTGRGLRPGRLCLDLADRTDDDDPLALAALHRLAAAGVRLALEDVDAGRATLARLRRLPVAVVRLDAGFTAHLDGRPDPLLEGLLALGRRLDVAVVAAGVETVVQRDVLLAAGCMVGQGRLWCPPVPPHSLAAAVAAIQDPAGDSGQVPGDGTVPRLASPRHPDVLVPR